MNKLEDQNYLSAFYVHPTPSLGRTQIGTVGPIDALACATSIWWSNIHKQISSLLI